MNLIREVISDQTVTALASIVLIGPHCLWLDGLGP